MNQHHTSMTSLKQLSDNWSIHMSYTHYQTWSTIWFSRSTTWFKVDHLVQGVICGVSYCHPLSPM